jgi:hypothetical protein
MKIKQLLFVSALAAGLIAAACLSKEGEPSGVQMASAAARLVDSLAADQKTKGVFDFDDKERTNWHFVPLQNARRQSTRKGLPMGEMTDEQKETTRALLRAGTSKNGYHKAITIMSLESILNDLEKKTGGTMVRDPGWYFLSIFGSPSKTGKWGWRIEGHHLSLNFVVDRGKVVASTPAFFGANPALVMSGPRKGLRTLPESEDYAKELFASLDAEQQKVARQKEQFPEIEQGKAAPHVGAPKGLPAGRMTDKQRDTLNKLIEGYADRMLPEVASAEMAQVKSAGLDKVHFAFAQADDKPGKPYTYRVQGPTFVIEFLDVQPDSAGNPANHIHSCWRDLQGDFGIPVK